MEHTDITVANIGRAVLQWAYSTKLSVAAITKCQCYNLKKSSILLNNVKDTSHNLNLQVQTVNYQLQLQLMRIHAEVVETALYDSLYSLKFQV